MGVVDGSGVNVFLGVAVMVGVAVNVGTAVRVCMDAASAVHWINTLMSFELSVGMATGVAGTQARMRARAAKQSRILFACKGVLNWFDFFINA